ncbi:MAG: O-antigen ligase family protein [Eubacterium sp.]|nr:O-antigen ligase family protein [Eubacterium sp.]
MINLRQTLVKFYVIVTLLFMPLYYENGYFNTLDAKSHIFWVASGIVIAVTIIIAVLEILVEKRTPGPVLAEKGRFSVMDGAILSFGIVALVSCVLSDYKVYAFTGSQGWNIGGWTIIALVFTYFFVSRNYTFEKDLWVYSTIACACLYVLGLLNGLGVDPLGLHAKLADSEMFEYIATIGNINSYSGYLSLSLPLLSMVAIIDERRWLRNTLYVVLFFGYTNLFTNNSAGGFLGVGVGFCFLIYYCLKDPSKYRRLLTLGLIFSASCLLMELAVKFWPIEMVELSDVSLVLTDKLLFVPIAVVCGVLLLVDIKKHEIFTERFASIVSKIFAAIVIVAVIAAVAYTATHFSGKWGTKRGWIWGFAVSVFSAGSIREKLFGVGPDCFGIPVMDMFEEFINEHWGKRIANAHNEFMQYLVTTGIFGLASYCMMWITSFVEYVKRISWRDEKAPFFFAIMGYMGQAIVNNPQALNMATLFLFFGIYRSFDLPHEDPAIIVDDTPSKGKKKSKKKSGKRR